MTKTDKYIIIVEGADACGKSQLCEYLRNYVEGKCHSLHSNYNPKFDKKNHYRQHILMSKFVVKQFDKKHYTGNNLVILDRNYISDICYGQIGYGSKGSLDSKFKKLDKIFDILTKNKDVKVRVVYCKPSVSKFEEISQQRDELLTSTQSKSIQYIYDEFFTDIRFFDTAYRHGIKMTNYDFTIDSDYSKLIERL